MAGIAAVVCLLAVVLAALMTDLRDRALPEALGARASITVMYPTGSNDDAQLRAELAEASARFGLGLVRALPEVEAGSGAVYALLERADSSTEPVPRFGTLPDARLYGSARLDASPTAGEYLVTGQSPDRVGFTAWAESSGIDIEWKQDSPLEMARLLVSQPSFLAALFAVLGLVTVALIGWLTVRSRGRALSVFAGIQPGRSALSDLRTFSGVFLGTSGVLVAATMVAVGVARGWVFAPRFGLVVGIGIALSWIVAVLIGAVLLRASVPTAASLVSRVPPMRSLGRAGAIARLVLLAMVLISISPAWATQARAGESARQLSQWQSLGDRVELVVTGVTEVQWQELSPRLGNLLRTADERGVAALSTVWDRSRLDEYGITPETPPSIMFATPTWFPDARLPDGERVQPSPSVAARYQQELEIWAVDAQTAATLSANLIFIVPPLDADVLGVGLGNATLEARPGVHIAVFDSFAPFKSDILASLATTGNIVLSDLATAQALIQEFGLTGEVRARYIAENGLMHAQFAAGFAALTAASLAALILGLLLASSIGARIHAEVNARIDHPLRVAGVSPLRVVAARVRRESVQGVVVIAVVGTLVVLTAQPGAWLVVLVGAAALALSPLTHLIAGQRTFIILRRRLI
ncbi:hypothetical protein D9V32_15030 [Mycetocola tolaasinivorans]|uniref:FtsX-like permease family protein n=1 Tax=Mycetocola tolaasinivorans TaxID=76635 RepID=A0A3L6ZYF6_9MICO|nr:hypothetical protein D9V32_15030 [Mycetocola tolaasinivorans]